MVGYKYVIYQRVNSVLDSSYFRANSLNMRTIPKPDNYNEYDYNQALGEKQTGRRQYIIKGLSMRSGSED